MKYDEFIEEGSFKKEHVWIARPTASIPRNLPLLIEAAGDGNWEKGCLIHQEKAPGYGIEYLCEGDMILIQDGREHIIRAGTVYLLQRGKNHSYRTGPSGFLRKYFLRLGGLGLDTTWRLLGLHNCDVPYLSDPDFFTHSFESIMKLIKEDSDEGNGVDVELSCRLYKLLLTVSQVMLPSIPAAVLRTLDYMQENLNRTLTREELCRCAGVSMTHLNRLFTGSMGYTPMAYFLKQKFEWTAQLLRTTKMSVKEIAYMAGFSDSLYYSAQFKKYFGISPKNYRKDICEPAAREGNDGVSHI